MNNEEKETIEQLKSWREYIIKHRDSVNKANDIEFYLRTALNLIEKQSKEVKELKEDRKSYSGEYIHNNPWLYKELNELYIFKTTVKEKIDSKFREAKGLYERGVQPQAQYTMKLLRDLEEELLSKED